MNKYAIVFLFGFLIPSTLCISCGGNENEYSSVSIEFSFFRSKDSTAFNSIWDGNVDCDLYYDYDGYGYSCGRGNKLTLDLTAYGIDEDSFLGQPGNIYISCLADSTVYVDTSFDWRSILFQRENCNGRKACAKINIYVSDTSKTLE